MNKHNSEKKNLKNDNSTKITIWKMTHLKSKKNKNVVNPLKVGKHHG